MEFPEIMALYNSLFTKQKVNFLPEHSMQTSMMFTKWLMREPELLPIIRPLVNYLFFVSAKHYFALLYTHIPKRAIAPKIKKKGTKIKTKDDKVLNKVREVLGWSAIEMEKTMDIVEKVILVDKKHWKSEFGL